MVLLKSPPREKISLELMYSKSSLNNPERTVTTQKIIVNGNSIWSGVLISRNLKIGLKKRLSNTRCGSDSTPKKGNKVPIDKTSIREQMIINKTNKPSCTLLLGLRQKYNRINGSNIFKVALGNSWACRDTFL